MIHNSRSEFKGIDEGVPGDFLALEKSEGTHDPFKESMDGANVLYCFFRHTPEHTPQAVQRAREKLSSCSFNHLRVCVEEVGATPIQRENFETLISVGLNLGEPEWEVFKASHKHLFEGEENLILRLLLCENVRKIAKDHGATISFKFIDVDNTDSAYHVAINCGAYEQEYLRMLINPPFLLKYDCHGQDEQQFILSTLQSAFYAATAGIKVRDSAVREQVSTISEASAPGEINLVFVGAAHTSQLGNYPCVRATASETVEAMLPPRFKGMLITEFPELLRFKLLVGGEDLGEQDWRDLLLFHLLERTIKDWFPQIATLQTGSHPQTELASGILSQMPEELRISLVEAAFEAFGRADLYSFTPSLQVLSVPIEDWLTRELRRKSSKVIPNLIHDFLKPMLPEPKWKGWLKEKIISHSR